MIRKYSGLRYLSLERLNARVVCASDLTQIVPDSGQANDFITNSNQIFLSGIAEPSSRVEIQVDGFLVSETSSDYEGKWSLAHAINLSEGAVDVVVRSLDAEGEVLSYSQPKTIRVDTESPASPQSLLLSRVSSVQSKYDFAISGVGVPGDTIDVYQIGGGFIGSTKPNELGEWRIVTNDSKLIDKGFRFVAIASDIAGNSSESSEPVSYQPNIILINMDDMRADDVGAMPFVSQLQAESTVFENAFVPTALSGPSRASLMTGLFAQRSGVLGNAAPLGGALNQPAGDTILPGWLQSLGYTTGLFGKDLSLPGIDSQNGFDILQRPPVWDRYFANLGAGVFGYGGANSDDGVMVDLNETEHISDRIVKEVNQFFEVGSSQSDPLFAYVAYLSPHDPGISAERHQGLESQTSLETPPSFNVPEESLSPIREQDLAQLLRWRQGYLESLRTTDEGVESIFAALNELSLIDNTVIVFTSDNGLFFGEHAMIGKQSIYDESIRVPLFLWDGRDRKGSSRDAIALNVDIGPTLVDLAGVATL